MFEMFDRSTLVIIPCCAAKSPGGTRSMRDDPLKAMVSSVAYDGALRTRAEVLDGVRSDPKFISEKYAKNMFIVSGQDFDGERSPERAMSALDRYEGLLYRAKGLKERIRDLSSSDVGPRVLILSALYGPLHPLSPIQDYNLMMSDRPAKPWSAAFPRFLANYVEQNSIRRAALYVGTSTAYFKIARKALIPLLAARQLDSAVQYHVVDGGTRETPTRHGALLAAQLAGVDCEPFFCGGMTREVSL